MSIIRILASLACIVFCLDAGCAARQAQVAALPPLSVRQTGSSVFCPAYPGGTGVLPDGDFSGAIDPGGPGLSGPRDAANKGQTFAPGWVVIKRNVDFYGTNAWEGTGLDGLCSVDLDGWVAGGIAHYAFRTKPGTYYTLSFAFSGNGGSPPTVKTMRISVDSQWTIMTWNTSGGYDAQNGDYTIETWQFEATKQWSTIRFVSEDPKDSASGPVVAGLSITEN